MATHLPVVGGHAVGFGATTRTDKWWVGPAITFAVFTTFIVYTTWAAFQGNHYWHGPYLSPFYSPILFADPSQLAHGGAPTSEAWFGAFPSWWPSFIPASPAILILVFPGGFRFTCYYYRKAYYRSFAGSPPGCAVGPMSKRKYRGETMLLVIQNLHRYMLYAALVFVVLLSWDAVKSFHTEGEGYGIGVGSIMLTINAFLIAAYAFGCHSFRHLIGGGKDCMSCGNNTLTYSAWKRATWFNSRHMQFAWLSLFWVMLTDLYIRLVSMGHITDLHTWKW